MVPVFFGGGWRNALYHVQACDSAFFRFSPLSIPFKADFSFFRRFVTNTSGFVNRLLCYIIANYREPGLD